MSNKVTPEQESELSALYQQRKADISAPSDIKSRVFSPTRMKQSNHSTSTVDWFRLLSGVALAASTLLFVGLVSMNQQNLNALSPRTVQVHHIQGETPSTSERIHISYQQHTYAHQQRTQRLEELHQQTMLLTHLDDGWELDNCNETIVQVSNELVKLLGENNTLNEALRSGSWVQVYFDHEGHIRKIIPSDTPALCQGPSPV